MARDYKHASPSTKPASKGNPFIAGILIGLILGIGLSVAVAIVIKGAQSPFVDKDSQGGEPSISSTAPESPDIATPQATTESAEAQPAANRFDFYKILPGTEVQVTEQEIRESRTAQPSSATPAQNENYFLQVGAFQTEQEADNTKAKLALLGMEAVIQTANLDDKGIWHRVRVGPFSNIEQISKYRAELTKSGFNADLIKIHSNTSDQ